MVYGIDYRWSLAGSILPNQSKKIRNSVANCSQETRNSLCRNNLSVVLTSKIPTAHDLERKFKSHKHIWHRRQEILHTQCLHGAENNSHFPHTSCCPQRKPSRRSPLKPRKKVPARQPNALSMLRWKRRQISAKKVRSFSKESIQLFKRIDERERAVVVYVITLYKQIYI